MKRKRIQLKGICFAVLFCFVLSFVSTTTVLATNDVEKEVSLPQENQSQDEDVDKSAVLEKEDDKDSDEQNKESEVEEKKETEQDKAEPVVNDNEQASDEQDKKPENENKETDKKKNTVLRKEVKTEKEADEDKVPVSKVIVHLKARTGSGWSVVQTWNAVKGGSNTWANADKTATKYSPIQEGKTTYTYNGKWVDDFGNTYTIGERKQGADFIALFDGKEGPEAEMSVYAQYDEQTKASLEVEYIDKVAHGSGFWSDPNGAATNYTHTFKTPPDIPENYEFLYWEQDNEEKSQYTNGSKFKTSIADLTEDTKIAFLATYNYQPGIQIVYHYEKDGMQLEYKTEVFREDVDIYDLAPEGVNKWFDENDKYIEEGEVVSAPEKILTNELVTDGDKVVNVYAKYCDVELRYVNEDESVLKTDSKHFCVGDPINGDDYIETIDNYQFHYYDVTYDSDKSAEDDEQLYADEGMSIIYHYKEIKNDEPEDPQNPEDPKDPTHGEDIDPITPTPSDDGKEDIKDDKDKENGLDKNNNKDNKTRKNNKDDVTTTVKEGSTSIPHANSSSTPNRKTVTIPDTGDHSNRLIWLIGILLSLTGIAGLGYINFKM